MKLTIESALIKVTDITPDQSRRLDKYFSIQVPGYFWSKAFKMHKWDGRHHFYNRLGSTFPSGLLHVFEKFAHKTKWDYTIADNRPDSGLTSCQVKELKGITLYDYQEETVKLCLQKKRGIVALATNAGKTIVAAAILKSLPELPCLFLVGSKDLMKQTMEVFEKLLQAPATQFGAGIKEIGHTTIATVQSIGPALKKKKNLKDKWKILFLDETHHAGSDSWYSIAKKLNVEYRFGLSGTPFDEKDPVRNFKLIGVTGPVINRVSNKDLIEKGLSADPTIIFHRFPLPFLYTNYQQAVKLGIERNRKRNQYIADTVYQLAKQEGQKILILTPRRKHGLALFFLLRNKDVDVFYNHGGTALEERRNSVKTFRGIDGGAIVIATTIYDEGVDIPEINALFRVGGGKSDKKSLQQVGRALRRKEGDNVVQIHDFIDEHNDYLLKHSIQRMAVYIAEGFKVVGRGKGAALWIKENTQKATNLRKAKRKRSSKLQKARESSKTLDIASEPKLKLSAHVKGRSTDDKHRRKHVFENTRNHMARIRKAYRNREESTNK